MDVDPVHVNVTVVPCDMSPGGGIDGLLGIPF